MVDVQELVKKNVNWTEMFKAMDEGDKKVDFMRSHVMRATQYLKMQVLAALDEYYGEE